MESMPMLLRSQSPAWRQNRGPATDSKESGFTILEMLVVAGILGLIVLIGLPALLQTMARQRTLSVVNQAKIHMRLAQQEALRRGVEVVIHVDDATGDLVAFADVPDENGVADRRYDPDPSRPYRTVDYEVLRLKTIRRDDQAGVTFAAPAGGNDWVHEGSDLPDSDGGLIYRPDGSLVDAGGFLIGDFRSPGEGDKCGNCFRIAYTSVSGQGLQVEKYIHETGQWIKDGIIFGDSDRTKAQDSGWTWY